MFHSFRGQLESRQLDPVTNADLAIECLDSFLVELLQPDAHAEPNNATTAADTNNKNPLSDFLQDLQSFTDSVYQHSIQAELQQTEQHLQQRAQELQSCKQQLQHVDAQLQRVEHSIQSVTRASEQQSSTTTGAADHQELQQMKQQLNFIRIVRCYFTLLHDCSLAIAELQQSIQTAQNAQKATKAFCSLCSMLQSIRFVLFCLFVCLLHACLLRCDFYVYFRFHVQCAFFFAMQKVSATATAAAPVTSH